MLEARTPLGSAAGSMGSCSRSSDQHTLDLKIHAKTFETLVITDGATNCPLNLTAKTAKMTGQGTMSSSPPGTMVDVEIEVQDQTFSGPFAMLMYSKDIQFHHANHLTKTISASGRMRSITHVGGALVEDVDHDFLAIAKDNGATDDRFDVHFSTTFWQPGNPLCTPPTEVPGKCRFGGVLVTDNSGQHQMGDVTVGH